MVKFTRVNDSFTEKTKRFIKVLGFGKNDVQTPDQIAPFGIDSNPVKGMLAVQIESSVIGESVVMGYIHKDVIAAKGETHIFSTDEDGVEQFRIKLRDNGTVEIGGDADNAVRYSKMAERVDELKGDLNDLKQVFASWIVTPQDGGLALKTALATYFATPIAKQISAAKIDEIKVP